jgi:glycosyltransferase involved in cell wall biosynthesis
LLRALIKVPGVSFSANSASVALAYEVWLGLPPGTIGVMPNAVPPVLPDGDAEDQAVWQDVVARSPDCTQTVLGIFRFDHNKRPEFWLQIAAAYVSRHPGTRFAILGRGHQFQRCQDLITELGLQDRVFLCGATRHVGFYLHKADLVMHLARMEGLPNVLIEAHLAGVAVLATPAGGTSEVVEHGLTGHILSQSEDPGAAEIQSALEQMLQDPGRLGEMGQVALSHAKQRFLLDQILGRTVTLFLDRT